VFRQTGSLPRALADAPALPRAISYIWDWFLALSRRRGQGMSGPIPLSNQEVKAWADNLGCHPSPWEIEVIFGLDDVFLEIVRGRMKAENDS